MAEIAHDVEVLAEPCVYLLCFEPKFGHAKHYVGSTNNLKARMLQHEQGNGSALTAVALRAGCKITLVRVWYGCSVDAEYWLKVKYKASRKLCPRCAGAKAFAHCKDLSKKRVPRGTRRNRGKRT